MKKLLIVGGGYTSIDLAHKLKNTFDITIIEPKKVFTHYIASLRALVSPEWNSKIILNYPNFNIIHDVVKSIDFNNNSILTSGGNVIKYDTLVIATGVEHGIFANHDLAQRINKAQNILIEGGGPIGIELVGELLEFAPNKKITLIHNKDTLLDDRYNTNMRTKLTKLVSSKINLILFPSLVDRTDYDLVIKSYGISPNSGFIDSRYKDTLGFIEVDNQLRIIGTSNAYALGDINNIEKVKTLVNGYRQSKFLANHLTKPKGVYTPNKDQIISIPFGTKSGYTSLPFGIVVGPKATSLIKGKDLMLGKVKKNFGID